MFKLLNVLANQILSKLKELIIKETNKIDSFIFVILEQMKKLVMLGSS